MGFFQRHQKQIVAALAIILALALILSLISSVFVTVDAVTQSEINDSQSEIDDLKKESEQLQEQMQNLEDNLSDLQDEINSALSQKLVLEEEIELLNDQIENTRNQINDYNAIIADYEATISEYDTIIADYDATIAEYDTTIADYNTSIAEYDNAIDEYEHKIEQAEEDLAAKEIEQAEHYDAYCLRVRALEEMGSISYLEIIFSATSFSDLLDRITLVGDIMAYDKALEKSLEQDRTDIENLKIAMSDYQQELISAREGQDAERTEQVAARQEQAAIRQEQDEARQGQKNAKAEQEAAKADLEDALETLDVQKSDVDEKKDTVDELLVELQEQEDIYESQLNDLEDENSAIDSAIAEKQAELEKQLQASNYSITSESGYLWPIAGRYTLSSLFGSRIDPFTGQAGNHRGIDIPASSGTSILAAKSGIVITSGYDSSYGNYVVISHGNNDSTLYGHMSSRAVNVGDSVSQGQVIGYVGSTGRSTGNHLHFEVRINGNRVDPVDMYPDLNLYYSSNGSTVLLSH